MPRAHVISAHSRLGVWVFGYLGTWVLASCFWAFGPLGICSAQQQEAPELTVAASKAIDKGLQFMLDNQSESGAWGASGGERTTAITALGLMAFMSKGEFPGPGPTGEALARAKDWLLDQAQKSPDGYLGSTMYEHGLATLALTELWGMTGDLEEQNAIHKAIEAAVDVILRSQSSAGGWRYQPSPSAGEDTSVTIMVFIGLASARQAGIAIPDETIDKVLTYLKTALNSKNGGFVYRPTGVGTAAETSMACTGGGAYIAQLAGARDTDMVEGALRYMEGRMPGIFSGTGYYYYCHYYAIQAMVQAGDERYAKWYPQIRDALISRQSDNGSWSGASGGVGHETPMAIIILATPHRYIPIYQR
jgi:hypothetical protein